MQAGSLNTMAVSVAYVMVLFVLFIFFLFWWRARLGKKLGGGEYLVGEMIPPAGKAHTELLHVINGLVKIRPKNGKKGRAWKVSDMNTYPIDYPSLPNWLGILRVTAEKVVIDEESAEPLTNRRGIGGITPEQLYAWEEGISTQAAVAMSKADEESKAKIDVKKKAGFSWTWIIIGIIVVAVVVVGTILLKNHNASKEQLGIAEAIWAMMG